MVCEFCVRIAKRDKKEIIIIVCVCVYIYIYIYNISSQPPEESTYCSFSFCQEEKLSSNYFFISSS